VKNAFFCFFGYFLPPKVNFLPLIKLLLVGFGCVGLSIWGWKGRGRRAKCFFLPFELFFAPKRELFTFNRIPFVQKKVGFGYVGLSMCIIVV
jgi:hypothetical protein